MMTIHTIIVRGRLDAVFIGLRYVMQRVRRRRRRRRRRIVRIVIVIMRLLVHVPIAVVFVFSERFVGQTPGPRIRILEGVSVHGEIYVRVAYCGVLMVLRHVG